MCFFMSAISPAGPLARPALAAFWERCAACSGECAQQYALSPRADKEQGVPSRLCPEHLGMTPTPLRYGLLWHFATFVQSSSLLVSRLAAVLLFTTLRALRFAAGCALATPRAPLSAPLDDGPLL